MQTSISTKRFKNAPKLKKYLRTNMARARIEKASIEIRANSDLVNQTSIETQLNSLSHISDGAIGHQDFSTAATTKMLNHYKRTGSIINLRKCESLENISNNILTDATVSEYRNAGEFASKWKGQEWMKTIDDYELQTSDSGSSKVLTNHDVKWAKLIHEVKTSYQPQTSLYNTTIKKSDLNRIGKDVPKTDNSLFDYKLNDESSKRSSLLLVNEDSPTKFLQSSLVRCRVLPKTYNKISLNKMAVSRSTKPKPFVLSSGNHSKPKKDDKRKVHKQFKARKMPDLSLPFYIFKNDRELTTFEEFDFATNRKDNLDKTCFRQKSHTSLLIKSTLEIVRSCKTPRNFDQNSHRTESLLRSKTRV